MYPAFYREIGAIDRERDATLKVAPVKSYRFASEEHVLPAFFDELPALAREYPVVFTTHEVPVMVAVVGHRANRFIDDKGAWKEGAYVPAVLRTYPFAGLQDEQGNLAFCIDRRYDGIGARGGERVFEDNEGTFTPFGRNAAAFAASYVEAFRRTRQLTQKLRDLDLLVPATATVTKNGETFNFSGFQQIDSGKLPDLPPDVLKEMIGSRDLYASHLHLYSLNNFSRIV